MYDTAHMGKTARTEIVGVRFTPEERDQVERLAKRMGGVSLSDCIRAATKMYVKLRLDPRRCQKYWEPFFMDLVKSGEIAEMDLVANIPRVPRS